VRIGRESGPGIGFWISVAIGAVAAGGALAIGASVLVSFGVLVVVTVVMALLLS
jgi:hypothetical protein